MSQNANNMNRLQILEQQQLNHQRRIQQESMERQEAKIMQKLKAKYNHVKSHGYGHVMSSSGNKTSSNRDDDVQIRVYVRECDGDAAQRFVFYENETLPSNINETPACSTGAGARAAGRESCTKNTDPTRATTFSTPVNCGKVPKYLQQRKAELQAEKQFIEEETRRQQELAKIPPGHRFVSEEEKAETLKRLEVRQKELEVQLRKIPIRFDTESIKTRRRNIDEELRQIEAAKLKFGTTKPLYIPIN